MTIGIYRLKFKGTDKCYIGQSNNIELRYISHCTSLRAGKSSQKLQEAYYTYGMPKIEVLVECSIDELNDNENLAIEIFDSVTCGFNTMSSYGHRSELKGELAGNSKYSNELIAAVFKELVHTDKTHNEIQETWGITRGALSDISSCISHRWLKDTYPEDYAILEQRKLTRRSESITRARGGAKYGEYPKVLSPEGNEYEVKLLRAFCREHGLNHGPFGEVLRGRRESHKGWKVSQRVSIQGIP